MTGEGDEYTVIEMAKRGDPAAVKQLIDTYADTVYRFSYNVCRNADRAEHTTQETFLSILGKLGQYDHRSKLSTWIYSIVVNHCLMLARQGKMRRTRSLDENGFTLPEAEMPLSTDDPHSLTEQADTRRHLDAAISRLSPEYRMVFVLRDIDGLSAEEVAKIMGISVPAVKSRLHRARKFLREQLAPLFQEDRHG
ncbi:MAG: RNA polymerase sigma factor [Bacteroidota bacterium]|nr:RNA polymerase sigma factor [Bacteroidota bacterium]